MKTFFKRLWADTPTFFKKLRAFGLSLSATGTTLVAIPNIPDKLKTYAATAIWVGLAIAAISQLTVKDPSQIQ